MQDKSGVVAISSLCKPHQHKNESVISCFLMTLRTHFLRSETSQPTAVELRANQHQLELRRPTVGGQAGRQCMGAGSPTHTNGTKACRGVLAECTTDLEYVATTSGREGLLTINVPVCE